MKQQCTKCGEEKPLCGFWKDSRYKNRRMAQCIECKSTLNKTYRINNVKMIRLKDKVRYAASRDVERERHLIRKYGMSLDQYDSLFKAQEGQCAICQSVLECHLNVDHDHKTGIVRGLLCNPCNRMLGHARDSVANLLAGAKYLESSRK